MGVSHCRAGQPVSSEKTGSGYPPRSPSTGCSGSSVPSAGSSPRRLVPYLAFTRHENKPDSAFRRVVDAVRPPHGVCPPPPAHCCCPTPPHGQARETLLWACNGFFGLSLIASLVVHHPDLEPASRSTNRYRAAMVRPFGSFSAPGWGSRITAVKPPRTNASTAVDASTTHALLIVALVYGFAMLGFAPAVDRYRPCITIRTAREHLPRSA